MIGLVEGDLLFGDSFELGWTVGEDDCVGKVGLEDVETNVGGELSTPSPIGLLVTGL